MAPCPQSPVYPLPRTGLLSGGRTRHPPAPAAATFPACPGSCSQRGPDTTATSCAISSGILHLAPFLQSQPSPAAVPCSRGNRPLDSWAAQQRLAEPCGLCSASASLTSPEQGQSSASCLCGDWGCPSGPALLHPLPWDPFDTTLGHGSRAGTSSIGKAPTCRQTRGQNPGRSAGPRKAPQTSPCQEHGTASIAL